MKSITLLLATLLSTSSFAKMPEIQCYSTDPHQGVRYEITATDSKNPNDSLYIGRLIANLPEGLGLVAVRTSRVQIKTIKEQEVCQVHVKRQNEDIKNNLDLKIQAFSPGPNNAGKLKLQINGKKLAEVFSEVECFIDQTSFQDLCEI